MVDYNNFANKFAKSRKNMKWEEIDYFLEKIDKNNDLKILDIWCGSWRLLEQFSNTMNLENISYTWIDLSSWLLEEAIKSFPEQKFLELNMLDLDKIENRFNNIFFIASYHHLDNIEDREETLKKAYNLLEKWWRIFMTNWALNSEINNEKYNKALIKNSENKFKSTDYNIVFWENDRYYHCFDLSELEYLATKNNFRIIENRLFDSKRNFITILEK